MVDIADVEINSVKEIWYLGTDIEYVSLTVMESRGDNRCRIKTRKQHLRFQDILPLFITRHLIYTDY